jgi:hypothetical protein
MLGDESGKCLVTNSGKARRRLWEICSGGPRINDPCFRRRIWEIGKRRIWEREVLLVLAVYYDDGFDGRCGGFLVTTLGNGR